MGSLRVRHNLATFTFTYPGATEILKVHYLCPKGPFRLVGEFGTIWECHGLLCILCGSLRKTWGSRDEQNSHYPEAHILAGKMTYDKTVKMSHNKSYKYLWTRTGNPEEARSTSNWGSHWGGNCQSWLLSRNVPDEWAGDRKVMTLRNLIFRAPGAWIV